MNWLPKKIGVINSRETVSKHAKFQVLEAIAAVALPIEGRVNAGTPRECSPATHYPAGASRRSGRAL
jgi:hypothetical protein